MGFGEFVKNKLRNWLNINKGFNPISAEINEIMDFEANAFKNKIWYRGDPSELHQFYTQIDDMMGNTKFWQATASNGIDFRKIHSGLPALIIDMLCDIAFDDMNDMKFDNNQAKELWEEMSKEMPEEFFKDVFKNVLALGDGAIRFVVHPKESIYPIPEFYPADQVDFQYKHGKINKVIFKLPYQFDDKKYTLNEIHTEYGYTYKLFDDKDEEIPVDDIPQFRGLKSVSKVYKYWLCVPVIFGKSPKYPGRGKSVIDGKEDNFDSFDEAYSQWIEALRDNRTKQYIPDSMIRKNPDTGETLKPNPFDGRFIKMNGQTSIEGHAPTIDTENPEMDFEGLSAAYTTALDQCLQGLISPSTLGIDIKKLDNAEAQREKEKATLYTRNKIVKLAEKVIPKIVVTALKINDTIQGNPYREYEVICSFGEYANPSFEAVVETVGKAKQYKIMSNEQVVEEMYGDSLDDNEKEKEIERLNAMDGVVKMEEPNITSFDNELIDYE